MPKDVGIQFRPSSFFGSTVPTIREIRRVCAATKNATSSNKPELAVSAYGRELTLVVLESISGTARKSWKVHVEGLKDPNLVLIFDANTRQWMLSPRAIFKPGHNFGWADAAQLAS